MQRLTIVITGCSTVAVSSACKQEVTAPAAEIVLESLHFAPVEIEPGQPLILVAQSAIDDSIGPQPFLIRASSGASLQAFFKGYEPGSLGGQSQAASRALWAAFSDEELAALIGAWDHVVAIGFKEADAEWGVDNQGHSITSKETVARMKAWVEEQGVTITRESIFLPAVFGTMPADAGLVGKIRGHQNVDYLEPGGIPGTYSSESLPSGAQGFVALILTSADNTSGLRVQAGDVVTAEYRQPDGSVLRATASVL